jgi:hypothetical protein
MLTYEHIRNPSENQSATLWEAEEPHLTDEQTNVQVSEASDIQHPTFNIQLKDGILLYGMRLRRHHTVFTATHVEVGASNGIKSSLNVGRWMLNVGCSSVHNDHLSNAVALVRWVSTPPIQSFTTGTSR